MADGVIAEAQAVRAREPAPRLGKLTALIPAPFPRYPLGACLGARTLRLYSIGWVLAPIGVARLPQRPEDSSVVVNGGIP
jgi:hypothetical protein